jgi:hypothetical protein
MLRYTGLRRLGVAAWAIRCYFRAIWHDMSDAWYYAEGDKSVGPVTLETLKGILSRLTDARNVLIWHAGFAGWQKAATIRELSETFTQPPPIQSDGNHLPLIRPSLVIPVDERVLGRQHRLAFT